MIMIKSIGAALGLLVEKGEISRKDEAREYDFLMENIAEYDSLSELCSVIGLHLFRGSDTIYAAPVSGSKAFAYTNEDLRSEFGYSFDNAEVYTALFIIAVIVTEFFPEASREPVRNFLRASDVMEEVDKRIGMLWEEEDLADKSYVSEYNFETVARVWKSLPRVIVSGENVEETKEYGKRSKKQFIGTTLRFMIKEDMIRMTEEVNSEKFIYPTQRMEATIYEVFNDRQIQNGIYMMIDGLREEL